MSLIIRSAGRLEGSLGRQLFGSRSYHHMVGVLGEHMGVGKSLFRIQSRCRCLLNYYIVRDSLSLCRFKCPDGFSPIKINQIGHVRTGPFQRGDLLAWLSPQASIADCRLASKAMAISAVALVWATQTFYRLLF